MKFLVNFKLLSFKLLFKEDNNNNSTENNSIITTSNKQRKHKIIWFDPPYNKIAATNVTKIFLRLLHKHFPKTKRLHKIFENSFQIIRSHNRNIVQTIKGQELPCNCRRKGNCLIQRRCRMKNALYKCTASKPTKPQQVYIGITEKEWKRRYYNHTKSF